MTDSFSPLSPQALRANAALIRHLHAGRPCATLAELAADTGRDPENLRKSLILLEGAGLIAREPVIHLTPPVLAVRTWLELFAISRIRPRP